MDQNTLQGLQPPVQQAPQGMPLQPVQQTSQEIPQQPIQQPSQTPKKTAWYVILTRIAFALFSLMFLLIMIGMFLMLAMPSDMSMGASQAAGWVFLLFLMLAFSNLKILVLVMFSLLILGFWKAIKEKSDKLGEMIILSSGMVTGALVISLTGFELVGFHIVNLAVMAMVVLVLLLILVVYKRMNNLKNDAPATVSNATKILAFFTMFMMLVTIILQIFDFGISN